MCIHVYTCYYICKFWNQSVCACIVCICIHVYTCVYMYTHVGHIQATYTLLFVGAHNRPKTSGGGAATSGPHSEQPWAAALPLYPAIRDPCPDPFWRARAPCTRRGGGEQLPCAAHGPSTRKGCMEIPSWAPSEQIWVGGAAHRSRVRQQQHPKTPSWHWLSGVCMCMYVYVLACMYIYVNVSVCITLHTCNTYTYIHT